MKNVMRVIYILMVIVGAYFIYFSSTHSSGMWERVETNTSRVEVLKNEVDAVLENQKAIIDNQNKKREMIEQLQADINKLKTKLKVKEK